MKAKDLLYQLNDLPEDLLREAQPPSKSSKNSFPLRRWGMAAACCCLVAGAVLSAPLLFSSTQPESSPPLVDYSQTVQYSDLSFGDTYRPEGLQTSSALLSIIGFSEEELYAGKTQVEFWEVTVAGMEVKDYRYDVASDKFEPNGVLHIQDQTMVYQVQVEQVWYGESVQPGETVLLEDLAYGNIDASCLLAVGGRYVLPIVRQGDTLPEWQEVVSGDITLTSPYGIYYPYQPPIQRTLDGDYLLISDWTTLAERSRPVEMDPSSLDPELAYYEDRMRLVTGEDFARQMEALIQKMEPR